MNCPIDGTTLVISDRSGVEIDYCPECRGVWLDRGELDKIVERDAAYRSGCPDHHDRRDDHQQGWRDDHHHDRRDDHRGKNNPRSRESFLSNFFGSD